MFPRNGVIRVEIARGDTCGAKEVEGEGSTTVVISELGVGDKALDSGGWTHSYVAPGNETSWIPRSWLPMVLR